MTDAQERELPHNYEIEQALLGIILADNRRYEAVAEIVREAHFSDPAHGRIFAACGALIERGTAANPVTLKRLFDADPAFSYVGGAHYLARLSNSVVTMTGAADYARLIRDLWQRREIIARCTAAIDAAYSPDLDATASQVQERHEAELLTLADSATAGGGPVHIAAALDGATAMTEASYKAGGKPVGLMTGLERLDYTLGGLRAGNLYILAARPAMGKTSLALNAVHNLAQRGNGAAVFSLEMSAEQLAQRLQSDATGLSVFDMNGGRIDQDGIGRIVAANARLAVLPIYIDDTAGLTVAAIRSRCRRLKRRFGIKLAVIDYIGLMAPTDRKAQKVHQIEEITTGLKAMAKELEIPVIALSQLSRQVETRDDKRPLLSDLRDSGSIEQDADAVMFIYRDEYYLERAEPQAKPGESESKFLERVNQHADKLDAARGMAEIIVAKNRHGPATTVKLAFDAAITRFSNLDRGG